MSAGGRWYRVDHYLPTAGVILEADGAIKYDNRPDASNLISEDRERERHLRELGFALVRYTWAIAAHRPGELIHRARAAERQRLSAPLSTYWTLDSPIHTCAHHHCASGMAVTVVNPMVSAVEDDKHGIRR